MSTPGGARTGAARLLGRVLVPPRGDSPGWRGRRRGEAGLLPLLLVVCDAWELWFAFDCGGEGFGIVGPMIIGGTVELDTSYRLLAVLPMLVDWMGLEFKEWVEKCVGQIETAK